MTTAKKREINVMKIPIHDHKKVLSDMGIA